MTWNDSARAAAVAGRVAPAVAGRVMRPVAVRVGREVDPTARGHADRVWDAAEWANYPSAWQISVRTVGDVTAALGDGRWAEGGGR